MTTVAINVRMKQLIALLWKQFKVWRRLQLGPIALRFKFERSVRTTGGTAAVQGDSESRRAVHISERGFAQLQASPAAISGSSRSTARDLAVIVGVGPGFGYALARSVVAEGFDVVLISRNAERLDPLVADLRTSGRAITSYGGDATEEGTVESLFRKIAELHGVPTLVVYSIQEFGPGMAIDVELPAFESAWKHNCLGAFLVSRAAARAMKPVGRGTILFIGSTSSVKGRSGHLNLAVGKFGQRALAQVLSRELWPLGIHVAHAIIDADVAKSTGETDGHPQSNPADIAYSLIAIHRQPKSAWSSEIDLRPWNEQFWEHC